MQRETGYQCPTTPTKVVWGSFEQASRAGTAVDAEVDAAVVVVAANEQEKWATGRIGDQTPECGAGHVTPEFGLSKRKQSAALA